MKKWQKFKSLMRRQQELELLVRRWQEFESLTQRQQELESLKKRWQELEFLIRKHCGIYIFFITYTCVCCYYHCLIFQTHQFLNCLYNEKLCVKVIIFNSNHTHMFYKILCVLVYMAVHQNLSIFSRFLVPKFRVQEIVID